MYNTGFYEINTKYCNILCAYHYIYTKNEILLSLVPIYSETEEFMFTWPPLSYILATPIVSLTISDVLRSNNLWFFANFFLGHFLALFRHFFLDSLFAQTWVSCQVIVSD